MNLLLCILFSVACEPKSEIRVMDVTTLRASELSPKSDPLLILTLDARSEKSQNRASIQIAQRNEHFDAEVGNCHKFNRITLSADENRPVKTYVLAVPAGYYEIEGTKKIGDYRGFGVHLISGRLYDLGTIKISETSMTSEVIDTAMKSPTPLREDSSFSSPVTPIPDTRPLAIFLCTP